MQTKTKKVILLASIETLCLIILSTRNTMNYLRRIIRIFDEVELENEHISIKSEFSSLFCLIYSKI